jgi:hypothetical protein
MRESQNVARHHRDLERKSIEPLRLDTMALLVGMFGSCGFMHELSLPGGPEKIRKLRALTRAMIACAALEYLLREEAPLGRATSPALRTYVAVEFKLDECGGSLKAAMGRVGVPRATGFRHRGQALQLFEQGELKHCDWASDELLRLLVAKKFGEAGLTWSGPEIAEITCLQIEEARELLRSRLEACLELLPSGACFLCLGFCELVRRKAWP